MSVISRPLHYRRKTVALVAGKISGSPKEGSSEAKQDEKILKTVVNQIKNAVKQVTKKGSKRKQPKTLEDKSVSTIQIPFPKRQKTTQMVKVWTQPCIIDSVPLEIVIHIMKFLDIEDIQSLACSSKFFHKVTTDDLLWKEISTEKFGSQCIKMVPDDVDWKDFVLRRTSTWHGFGVKSPISLIQEAYASDPWKTLVSAMLVSRTTGTNLIIKTINNFLTIYSSPAHVLRAAKEEMKELIKPLGLQESRIKAIIQFTNQYFSLKWEEPIECFGIGPMANDSYKLFCKGIFSFHPADMSLNAYRNWAVQQCKEAVEKK